MTERERIAVIRTLAMLRNLRDHFGYDYPQWQELDDVIEDVELAFPDLTGETNDQR